MDTQLSRDRYAGFDRLRTIRDRRQLAAAPVGNRLGDGAVTVRHTPLSAPSIGHLRIPGA